MGAGLGDYDKGLATRLEAIRERFGYTQEQMAEIMGVSVNHYGRYIRMQSRVPTEKTANLIDRLGLSYAYVLHGRGPIICDRKEDINLASAFMMSSNRERSRIFAYASQMFEKMAEADELVDYNLKDGTVIEIIEEHKK